MARETNERYKRRILALKDAVDVLQSLLSEMPGQTAPILIAMKNVRQVSKKYAEHEQALEELAKSERKPPQRVAMANRRKPELTIVPLTEKRLCRACMRYTCTCESALSIVHTNRTTPVAPLDSMHTTRVDSRCNCNDPTCSAAHIPDEDKEYFEANPDHGGPNGSKT